MEKRFAPCKAAQLLRSMKLQEKDRKTNKESVLKESKDKWCLLTLDLKLFRSYFKGKHCACREFRV